MSEYLVFVIKSVSSDISRCVCSVQAKNQFYARTHAADESKNEYASQLQNFNAEQWKHFNNAIPHIFKVGRRAAALRPPGPASSLPLSGFQNLQAMDERRTVKLGETYQSFAEAERRVIPIISKCLEGMIVAAKAVDERRVGDQRRPGAGLVPPDCPSISCFMSSRPPRTRPSWWSRSNPALTLRGTTPSKTSARI